MALRLRRGTTAQRSGYTPLEGELVYDTEEQSIYIGDGTTAGGKLLSSGSSLIDNIDLNGNDIIGLGNINITGNVDIDGNLHTTGTITADGGTITLGNDDLDSVDFRADIASNLVPDADSTYDLGTTSKKWDIAYVNTVEATTVNANTVGNHTGDVVGSVFADNSTMLVDGVSGRIVGPVYADVTGNTAGTHTGPVIGNVLGNVTGNLEGNVVGEFVGAVKNNLGQVLFDTRTDDDISLPISISGNVEGGSLIGAGSNVLVDGGNESVNCDRTVGEVSPKFDNGNSVGNESARFTIGHFSSGIWVGGDASTFEPEIDVRLPIIIEDDQISVTGGVRNRNYVETTLDVDIPTGSRTIFTVSNTDGIRAGALVSLPGVSIREVLSAVGGTVTTTEEFAVSEDPLTFDTHAVAGMAVRFYNPPTPAVNFRDSVPPDSKGEPGDRPGMVFANANYVYFCVADWDGTSNIWVRIATILATF